MLYFHGSLLLFLVTLPSAYTHSLCKDSWLQEKCNTSSVDFLDISVNCINDTTALMSWEMSQRYDKNHVRAITMHYTCYDNSTGNYTITDEIVEMSIGYYGNRLLQELPIDNTTYCLFYACVHHTDMITHDKRYCVTNNTDIKTCSHKVNEVDPDVFSSSSLIPSTSQLTNTVGQYLTLSSVVSSPVSFSKLSLSSTYSNSKASLTTSSSLLISPSSSSSPRAISQQTSPPNSVGLTDTTIITLAIITTVIVLMILFAVFVMIGAFMCFSWSKKEDKMRSKHLWDTFGQKYGQDADISFYFDSRPGSLMTITEDLDYESFVLKHQESGSTPPCSSPVTNKVMPALTHHNITPHREEKEINKTIIIDDKKPPSSIIINNSSIFSDSKERDIASSSTVVLKPVTNTTFHLPLTITAPTADVIRSDKATDYVQYKEVTELSLHDGNTTPLSWADSTGTISCTSSPTALDCDIMIGDMNRSTDSTTVTTGYVHWKGNTPYSKQDSVISSDTDYVQWKDTAGYIRDHTTGQSHDTVEESINNDYTQWDEDTTANIYDVHKFDSCDHTLHHHSGDSSDTSSDNGYITDLNTTLHNTLMHNELTDSTTNNYDTSTGAYITVPEITSY